MFISYSSGYVLESNTTVDNLFISEYLPQAPEMCVKVYLYGLYLCGHAESPDNNINAMATLLNLTPADLRSAFTYWQELGLVAILNFEPLEIKYLPVKQAIHDKKYDSAKYADFNRTLEQLIARQILPNEYNEYYYMIETYHFEPQAFIMIVKYCIELKGEHIGYKYILTVARNWAAQGAVTCERVEEKILEYDKVTDSLIQVYKAMGSRKKPDVDDRALYLKWVNSYDYDLDTILAVAAKTKRARLEKLDAKLTKYFESKLTSVQMIAEYENNKDLMYGLARRLNKIIGVYYEQLDHIVDTYITSWLSMGFEEEALEMIAEACFKKNIRTLDGFNNMVNKFYKQGLLSGASITNHLDRLSVGDERIKAIFDVIGLTKSVTTWDRDSYRTWTYSWGFGDEVILYCAELAKNATVPFSYMNKILAEWHSRKLTTLEQVQQDKQSTQTGASVGKGGGASKTRAAQSDIPSHTNLKSARTYSQSQLNALIDDISSIE